MGREKEEDDEEDENRDVGWGMPFDRLRVGKILDAGCWMGRGKEEEDA